MENTYMATTPSAINNLAPQMYNGDGDLEQFITDCQRFFEVSQISDTLQPLVVKAFIHRDLLATYENVDSKIFNFVDRLRKAFKRPTSLIQDLQEIINYRKGEDSAIIYCNKIEKMVDRILNHKWTKPELMSYFLTHCVDDIDVKKQIYMEEAKSQETIKTVIEKMDNIKKEVQAGEIANIHRQKTFANVLKERAAFPIQTNQQRRISETRNFNKQMPVRQNYDGNSRNTVICYGCQKIGHVRRDCPNNIKMCYGCKGEGHIRRECPYLTCSVCKCKGHLAYQCFRKGFQTTQSSQNNWNNNRRHRMVQRSVAGLDDADGSQIEELKTDRYPNAEAQSDQEMIGAIH